MGVQNHSQPVQERGIGEGEVGGGTEDGGHGNVGSNKLKQQLWRERGHVMPSSPGGRTSPHQHRAEGHLAQGCWTRLSLNGRASTLQLGRCQGRNEGRREGGERNGMEGYMRLSLEIVWL